MLCVVSDANNSLRRAIGLWARSLVWAFWWIRLGLRAAQISGCCTRMRTKHWPGLLFTSDPYRSPAMQVPSQPRGTPTQFVRRIKAPIVSPLFRSAVLSSETVNSSLFLSALGCLKRVKGNVPGFSTPVVRRADSVYQHGERGGTPQPRTFQRRSHAVPVELRYSSTGRQRILYSCRYTASGVSIPDVRQSASHPFARRPALSRLLCDRKLQRGKSCVSVRDGLAKSKHRPNVSCSDCTIRSHWAALKR
jgi:hypothetical protein